jgi:hypothetical protein
LRADIVEKGAAIAVREAIGVDEAVRRAIGLIVLQVRVARCRSVREAVLHRLRLMADMIKLASVVPGNPQ